MCLAATGLPSHRFTFTVTLSAAYDQAVTMSCRTVDGTAKTSDGKKEADETFYLDLFGVPTAGGPFGLLAT